MRDIINLRIKFRERFRPFAPSILEEHVADWFEIAEPTPYMEKVFPIREEKAITHSGGDARGWEWKTTHCITEHEPKVPSTH